MTGHAYLKRIIRRLIYVLLYDDKAVVVVACKEMAHTTG